METKVEKLKSSKVKLAITVTPDELVRHFKHAFEELASEVKISGFRPGKAPRAMVENSLGVTRIFSHGLDHAIQDYYVIALAKEKISPVAAPNVSIKDYPEYGLTEDEIKKALVFEAEVETFPEVELGDYSKVKIEAGNPSKPKEEDLKKVLDHLQKQKASFQDVEREAKKGDFIDIDFEGSLKGVKIDQMTSKHHPLVLGEGNMIPGFEDEIVGLKKGEEKTFKIKFPKDYQAKEYAGKEAEFKIKLNQLKEVILPELDDKFAASFGHKSVDELKKAITKSLTHEMEHQHEHELQDKVIEKLLPLLKVEVPSSLVNQEVARMLAQYEGQLQAQGLSFDAYLQSMKKERADLENEMRPQAEKNVKIGMLLGKVIQDQKMDEKDPEAGKKALDYLVQTIAKN